MPFHSLSVLQMQTAGRLSSSRMGGSMEINLLEVLENLGERELKEFKWFFQQSDFLKHFPSIPRSRLENADRVDTVDLMVHTYSRLCGDVVRKVLKKMRRNDLVTSLSNTRSRLTDVTEEKLQQFYTSTLSTSLRCTGQVQTKVHCDNANSDNVLTDDWEIISQDECLTCPRCPYIMNCTGMSQKRRSDPVITYGGETLWYVSDCSLHGFQKETFLKT